MCDVTECACVCAWVIRRLSLLSSFVVTFSMGQKLVVKVCRSMNNACWFLAILSYVCFTIWNPLKRLRQRLTILSKKATARCCFKESGSEWKERSSNLSWRRSCRHLVGEPPPCKQQTRTKEEGGLSKLLEEGSLSEGARTQRMQLFGMMTDSKLFQKKKRLSKL